MESLEVIFRSLWHALITFEVIASTVIHCTYGATILIYTLLTDVFLSLAAVSTGNAPPESLTCQDTEGFVRGKSHDYGRTESQSFPLPLSDPCRQQDAGPLLKHSLSEGALCSRNQHRDESDMKAPIVLLHGIFGFGHGKFGSTSYFGGAEYQDKDIYVPDLGSLTSIHDRARELFYYLKGGTVDYGEEHSKHYGHDRFGIDYARGKHEAWSAHRPVHLVGHSSGVQVARVLQHMLHTKAFEGYPDTTADWVASITSISGALNGTTRVYIDGLSVRDGVRMLPICLLQVLRIGVLIYEWLDLKSCKDFYCFGFGHFPLSRHRVGLAGLLTALANRSGPFATGDWVLPDLSLQHCFALNSQIQTHPNTFYFSYATVKTRSVAGRVLPAAMTIHPLLTLRCLQMSLWRRPQAMAVPYEGYRDEHWWHNDGALNTISMLYPRFPAPHPHCLLPLNDAAGSVHRTFKPGVWYYTVLEGDHILYIISRLRAGVKFEMLYGAIFRRCRSSLALAHTDTHTGTHAGTHTGTDTGTNTVTDAQACTHTSSYSHSHQHPSTVAYCETESVPLRDKNAGRLLKQGEGEVQPQRWQQQQWQQQWWLQQWQWQWQRQLQGQDMVDQTIPASPCHEKQGKDRESVVKRLKEGSVGPSRRKGRKQWGGHRRANSSNENRGSALRDRRIGSGGRDTGSIGSSSSNSMRGSGGSNNRGGLERQQVVETKGWLDLDLGGFNLFLRLPGVRMLSSEDVSGGLVSARSERKRERCTTICSTGEQRGMTENGKDGSMVRSYVGMPRCGCRCGEGSVRDVFHMLELCCPETASGMTTAIVT